MTGGLNIALPMWQFWLAVCGLVVAGGIVAVLSNWETIRVRRKYLLYQDRDELISVIHQREEQVRMRDERIKELEARLSAARQFRANICPVLENHHEPQETEDERYPWLKPWTEAAREVERDGDEHLSGAQGNNSLGRVHGDRTKKAQ